MIIDLLLIASIVALIHQSGFIENIDDWINSKWRFHHLPHPIRCCLCTTWWLSLLYIAATGNLSLFNVLLALLTANVAELIIPLFTVLKNALFGLINNIDKILNK